MNDVAEWEAIHRSRMWGTYPDIHVVRQVKKFLAQHPAPMMPQVLDIGCGAGASTGMMCDEGMDVYAFDSSETALGHMCERLGNKTFFPHLSTVQDFEPPSHRFDFILDNFSLTNIEHPPWERIMSWLKPGGWLIHASFEVSPKGTPKTWEHKEPGVVVERHSSWVEGNAFSFVVRRYIKPS